MNKLFKIFALAASETGGSVTWLEPVSEAQNIRKNKEGLR